MSTSKSCMHIKVSGVRCGSPSMRGEQFCYFHLRMLRTVRGPASRVHHAALRLARRRRLVWSGLGCEALRPGTSGPPGRVADPSPHERAGSAASDAAVAVTVKESSRAFTKLPKERQITAHRASSG